MITLGPYSFTKTDALRTFGNLGGLWDSMMEGRTSPSATALGEALRGRLATVLGADGDASLAELGNTAAKMLGDSPDLSAVLDDVWTTLREASTALRADGQLPATTVGRVTQLSASGGGVPKLPIATADVDHRGVVGDVQRVRVHHGRPWQALCIYADHPWRCLWRGSLQMTRTTRFLRMILQLRQIFFTEASTFMIRS